MFLVTALCYSELSVSIRSLSSRYCKVNRTFPQAGCGYAALRLCGECM